LSFEIVLLAPSANNIPQVFTVCWLKLANHSLSDLVHASEFQKMSGKVLILELEVSPHLFH